MAAPASRATPDGRTPHVPILDKDTTLCISLAARPSNIGTRFHNALYDELGLPFVYKAFAPTDLAQAIAGVRGLGIRGCSVSMPFKEDVIALVDHLDASAAAIASVNTIVNDGGTLTAYNTDYLAVRALLGAHDVGPRQSVVVRGSGGMAKAVVAALGDLGVTRGTVVARNAEAGRALAALAGFAWQPQVGDARADLLVNATPIGMSGAPQESEQAFDDATLAAAQTVLDVVAFPSQTPLVRAARAAGLQVVTGAEVIALQAAEQFVLYTGVRPSPEQLAWASELSRA